MDNVAEVTARRRWRRAATAIQGNLRELAVQMAVLNHRVSTRLKLNDADRDCLELIAQFGPISPSALARRAGLHPATMTGVLDRLERGGWVVRERDPADRRAVMVRALRERGGDLYRVYGGMRDAMNEICAGYTGEELQVIAGFLDRCAKACGEQADVLADQA
jgi:DNA-binding MarR family transcriptional regulator